MGLQPAQNTTNFGAFIRGRNGTMYCDLVLDQTLQVRNATGLAVLNQLIHGLLVVHI